MVKVPLVEIFKLQKSELAKYIKEKRKIFLYSIEPSEKKIIWIIFRSKAIYILQQMNPDSAAYNMPEIIPLPAESDRVKIEEDFQEVDKAPWKPETSFHVVNDTLVQIVHDELNSPGFTGFAWSTGFIRGLSGHSIS